MRADRHLLDLLDHPVERRAARLDAGLEERQRLDLLAVEPLGDAIVTREVQVDRAVRAAAVALVLGRRGLQQLRGEVACLGQQEHADLEDVTAGGDVDQIVFVLGVEGVLAGPVVHRPENLFKVPRVTELDFVEADLRLGRHGREVLHHHVHQLAIPRLIQQLEAMDQQVRLLAYRYGGSPALPSRSFISGVEYVADEADHYLLPRSGHIRQSTSLADAIQMDPLPRPPTVGSRTANNARN